MNEAIVGNLTAVESNYQWKILNFSSYATYKSGEALFSPYFHSLNNYKNSTNSINLQWRLRIYPSGLNDEYNKYISMYLENHNDFQVKSKYFFKILTPENSKNNITRSSDKDFVVFLARGEIVEKNQNVFSSTWGKNKFAKKEPIFSEQSQFLENDTLTISCKIYETSINPDDQEAATNDIYLETFNRYENLFESGKFSDLMFDFGEKKIQVHKAILSTASEVFQAMFDHEMQEQKDGVVKIVDIDFHVMKEMFRYIYAKKVNEIDNIASDLLVAADKYSVTELKELCEKILCKKLNIDNVLQYVELAVKYNATKLKSKAVEFAVKKLKNIVKTEEFQSLSSECKSELLLYVACNVLE